MPVTNDEISELLDQHERNRRTYRRIARVLAWLWWPVEYIMRRS